MELWQEILVAIGVVVVISAGVATVIFGGVGITAAATAAATGKSSLSRGVGASLFFGIVTLIGVFLAYLGIKAARATSRS